jgi:predicted transposase/invertase (TIGR01784 family)
LETSTNPMALIVKAQLKSLEAKKGDDARKYNIKFALIRELYKQGYDKEGIRSFFDFIDLIIRLPDDLEEKLFDEITKIEEDHKMPHLATWERTAEKRGEIRGEKRGEIKGKLETARRMLNEDIPIDRIIKYTGLTEEEIKGLIN